MINLTKTFNYKLIYVFRINDKGHKGLLKIGDASIDTDLPISKLTPSCKELNQAAKERINSYTKTASIPYDLLYTELAIREVVKDGIKKYEAFRDKNVHNVLIRSGINKHEFHMDNEGVEWFKIDLQTAKNAISAVKANRNSLDSSKISEDNSPIIFRPEQQDAIKQTIKQFKISDRMLWNAKMRFGKTLTALQVAKEMQFKRILIFTHRPVVSEGWFEDFNKIFNGTNYKFGSKKRGEKIENLNKCNSSFVYFASIQDLRGSTAVGGKFDKNESIFLIDWDFVIVDEAHEGTQTTLGQKVLNTIIVNKKKTPKLLELSGTPFNLVEGFKEVQIFTWDYIMEQRAKLNWPLTHFGDSNPYEELPQLKIFTYDLNKCISGYVDDDSAFNFKEFFRTWTGDVQKDYKVIPQNAEIGDFIHKEHVLKFLDLLTKKDNKTNYPFSKDEYRKYYKHTLWMVPGVKEAKALSKMLKAHPVFSQFKIINVAGDGDKETDYNNALKAVKEAIGIYPDQTYSITISCGRLTTGVTIPEWTAVFMLSGSFSTSASSYLQTIFRVQSPANINGKIKEWCSVFDFAPDRALKIAAEAGKLSSKVGSISDKTIMGEFLNFCPIISVNGSNMYPYNVDNLLQQLKKVYVDKVVKNGFDDRHIYNDNLLKLDDIELKDFEKLKEIIGVSKQTDKVQQIDINNQGFTNEEYERLQEIEKKPKKERTPEEIALLEERRKKKAAAQKAESILRVISIRIPLLIYGADVPENKIITVDNLTDIIDDNSWEEFMPQGVTKEEYKKFTKYYEKDIFASAGIQIRNIVKMADNFSPTERVIKISQQFSTFKNPDKETVLTPWRVVNMHLGDCLGGYNFYDEKFINELEEPRFIDLGDVTKQTLTNSESKILEINSKTGLYPLYVVYSIYRTKLNKIPEKEKTLKKQLEIWDETIKNNIYIICKTPMAKSITKRTLLGYRKGKINAHAFVDLINQLKSKEKQFGEKISRGSTWNRKEIKMEFDAIVGNPPYQESKGGTKNVDIWQYFLDFATKNSKYTSLIHPGRWLIPKKFMIPVRESIFSSGLVSFDYFPNSSLLFNGIVIDGGITVTFFKKDYSSQIKYYNNRNYMGIYNKTEQFFTNDFEKEAHNKLNPIIFNNKKTMLDRVFGNIGSLAGGEFGYRKNQHIDYLTETPKGLKKPLKIWANKGFGKASRFNWYFIDGDKLEHVPNKILSTRKVMIDKKGHAIISGKGNVINNVPVIVDKKCIASGDVLFVLPENDNDYELKLIKSLFMTKTVRFLMSITQKDLYVRGFENIPDYTNFIPKLKGGLFTDKFFYDTYKFSPELINHIEKSISSK